MTEYKINDSDAFKVGSKFYRLNNNALYWLEYTDDGNLFQTPIHNCSLPHEETKAKIMKNNSVDNEIPLKQGDIIKGHYDAYVVVANKLIPLIDFKCALREYNKHKPPINKSQEFKEHADNINTDIDVLVAMANAAEKDTKRIINNKQTHDVFNWYDVARLAMSIATQDEWLKNHQLSKNKKECKHMTLEINKKIKELNKEHSRLAAENKKLSKKVKKFMNDNC